MTFNQFEKSEEGGRPVELYEFEIDGAFTRFTSSEEDLTVDGNEYLAIPIARGSFSQSTGERSDNLAVSLPASTAFVQPFVNTPPGAKASFLLSRFHIGDPDDEVKVIFRGTLKSVVFTDDGHKAELQISPVTAAFNRTMPRMNYGALCGHMLYDARCKIVESNPAFQKFLYISNVMGDTITADGAGVFGANFFVAGFVEFNGDFRMVLEQSGDNLKLLLPFISSPAGEIIRCQAGCLLRMEQDCRDKYSNVVNFGGHPWVPQKNPFATGLD